MNGTPRYTQQSVAFPDLPARDRIVDEISVSFVADGGGTNGEFSFRWYNLGSGPEYGSVRVDCFSDGLSALLDPRVTRVLSKMVDKDVTPDALIGFLELEGVGPSHYHLSGLLRNKRLSLPLKAALQARYDAEKKLDP